MQIFITGTDTNIGKTLVSSWLCLHSGYDYFKPIQTGSNHDTDSAFVERNTRSFVHKESYIYKEPVSPHLAAKLENEIIDISKITLPQAPNLIIEGAGGVMVPINHESLMIDLMQTLSIPVILVSGTRLGTINHTLLSLGALKSKNIEILGVIMSGELNIDSKEAIEYYGASQVIAELPFLPEINSDVLRNISLTPALKQIFKLQL
jgi:dethiobiotin synthetase